MQKVLWLDLETTGLDEKKGFILEVGALVTDEHFNELDSYETAVIRSDYELSTMDSWCKKTHRESGLLDRVLESTVSDSEVETSLINFIEKNFPFEKPMLAGNSIHFDRKWLEHHYPDFAKRLHYRMIDVSGMARALDIFGGISVDRPKATAHRSMQDIRETSICLMKEILKKLKEPK